LPNCSPTREARCASAGSSKGRSGGEAGQLIASDRSHGKDVFRDEVIDPAGFEEYRKQVPRTVEKYGGKFLVRGGQVQTLEGDSKPKRIVVTEFSPSSRPGAGMTRKNMVR
jgi:hypothetical protein